MTRAQRFFGRSSLLGQRKRERERASERDVAVEGRKDGLFFVPREEGNEGADPLSHEPCVASRVDRLRRSARREERRRDIREAESGQPRRRVLEGGRRILLRVLSRTIDHAARAEL